jgi:general secretion pathway protein A
MYRSFYGLTLKPFQISSDPKFLWLGEKHQEALAVLKYGVLDNRGFLLLTGDVGTGKTTLINALVNSLGPDTIVAHVPDPGLTIMDFINYIASAFRLEAPFTSKGAFLVRFREFLEKAHTSRKQVLLIIDEAQRLDTQLLEEIRLLSNIELQQTKLINIFFVGQDEFSDILSRNENRALRQRMTLNYHIDPLTEEETGNFVKHRLKVAGTEKKIFSTTAISEIYAFSGGYPRLMNIICDHALLTGYVKGDKTIDGEMIAECAKELRLPKRQLRPPTPLIAPASLPRPVVLPNPAAPPVLARSGHRGAWLLFSFLLLALLGITIFYLSENGHLGKTVHQKIALLADTVKGKIGGHGATSPSPEKPAPVSEKSESAPESPPGITISRKIPPEPVNMPPSPNKVTAAVTQQPGTATAIPVEITAAIAAEAHPSEPAVPAQTDHAPPAPASTTRPQAPIRPEEQILPAPPPNNHLIVPFGHNSNDLSSEAYDLLNSLASYLKRTPGATITINGYTDNMGNPGYNLSLSGFRANIVKNYMIGHGIGSPRMTAVGLGSKDPIESNDTTEGRNANRRVEIHVRTP